MTEQLALARPRPACREMRVGDLLPLAAGPAESRRADVVADRPAPRTTTDDGLARLLRRSSTGRRRVLQRAWTARPYRVSGGERKLHVEPKQPVWGGTVDGRQHATHAVATKPRAILYETISTITNFTALQNRLAAIGPTAMWDTGLSVVLNMAYTPRLTYDHDGPTKRKSTKGSDLEDVKRRLGAEYTRVTQHWQGAPMHIVLAAWERRQRDGEELEVVQSSVPYTTLRVIAATDPGAGAIDAALRTNHDQVWHKIGDDDMPIFDPNPAVSTPELDTLRAVEESLPAYDTLVTFGYDLTTAGTVGAVREALGIIYATEMELRDRIATLGVPMYPSEPTTFYRPRAAGTMTPGWTASEQVKTGGSGQQLEGAKLVQALKGTGAKHFTFHSTMVQTAAGARNDRIVALLNGWWNNGRGDPQGIDPDTLDAEINRLDQSALRDGEFVGKALRNLGHTPKGDTTSDITRLVTEYRASAVRRACDRIRWGLYGSHKYAKVGL